MKLLLATANPHKIEELRGLLDAAQLELVSLRDFPAIEMPEETGATMRDNACLKARHCAEQSGLAALSDDSGIEVDALGRAPGVHSARWHPGNDADRTRALLSRLADTPATHRTARYRCAVCVALPDGRDIEREAVCEGVITSDERGDNGFGYDPIFELTTQTGAPPQYIGQTMAQVPPAVKAAVSHRARAVRAVLRAEGGDWRTDRD